MRKAPHPKGGFSEVLIKLKLLEIDRLKKKLLVI